MSYELICGDCATVMAELIADNSIDLTVTSPPYDNLRAYQGYVFDFEAVAQQLWRVTKPGGVAVWVVNDQVINGSESLTSFKQAIRFCEIGFRLHDTMIYFKNSVIFPDANRYHPSFEYMFVFSKGGPSTVNLLRDRKNRWGNTSTFGKKTERNPDGSLKVKGITFIPDMGIRFNVWAINSGFGHSSKDERSYDHPATFPESLARDHILSWSNPGDTVLDPFAGSGTTLKMALLNHRKAIGIEISSEYCEIIRKRMASVQPPAITEEGVFYQPEQSPLFEVSA